MRSAVTSAIWILLCLTLAVSVIGANGNRLFLGLLGVPESVMPYSSDYLRILYRFIGGSVLYNGCSSLLNSFGDSRKPLEGLILASVLNIVLDLLFVLKFGLGVRGVAIATVISQHVSAAYCLSYLIRRRHAFSLNGLEFWPKKAMIGLIFRTGVPAAFQSCLISLGGMSVQRLINSFGSAVMAAYAAACKIDSIAIQVIVSLGTAISVFTGQNMGKKAYERIGRGLRTTMVMAVTAAALIAAAAFVWGEVLMGLFLGADASPDTIAIGAEYLRIMGVAYLICGVMQSYQGVIRGAGDVNTCMVAGMTELAGKIVFSFALAPVLGATGIWIATPLSWGCGCIVPLLRYHSGKWKMKALAGESS